MRQSRYLSFDIDDVEHCVRESLGKRLEKSLRDGKALHEGRFKLPLTPKSVDLFVEPHQIFIDNALSREICQHLATLLSRKFNIYTQPEKLSSSENTSLRVLTTTRLGREIAQRMPRLYNAESSFVFNDYHLLRPEKHRILKHLDKKHVVILIDIVASGNQVRELIRLCEESHGRVVGVISFIDFSPRNEPLSFKAADDSRIEHLTFWRHPRELLEPQESDTPVDPNTLSMGVVSGTALERDTIKSAVMPHVRSLRLLNDSEVIHYGHYEVFGQHFDFAVDSGKLLSRPTLQRDEILRACENEILQSHRPQPLEFPTAIVMYPDMSTTHVLENPLKQRVRIARMCRQDKLKFVEARRGPRARGRYYWLTAQEVSSLKHWAHRAYGKNFSVLLLDDGACSGETILALLHLAREFDPGQVTAFVITNRMPHLHTQHHRQIERFEWAASQFRGLMHFNIPSYKLDNCPLCKERWILQRELKEAKSVWFRNAIEARFKELQSVDILQIGDPEQTLEQTPEQTLEQKPNQKRKKPLEQTFSTFSWDTGEPHRQTPLAMVTHAASARMAINSGVLLLTVLDEISIHENDELFRIVAMEITRRHDLQMAQQAEFRILRHLMTAWQLDSKGQPLSISRQTVVIEVLRYMRPEAILPFLPGLVANILERAAAEKELDLNLCSELLLLLKRVFSYRHLPDLPSMEHSATIDREIEKAMKNSRDRPQLRANLKLLRAEWTDRELPHRKGVLHHTIAELETLIRSQRPHHGFTTEDMRQLKLHLNNHKSKLPRDSVKRVDHIIHTINMATRFLVEIDDAKVGYFPELLDEARKNTPKVLRLKDLVDSLVRTQKLPAYIEASAILQGIDGYLDRIREKLRDNLVDPTQRFKEILADQQDLISQEHKISIEVHTNFGEMSQRDRIIIHSRLYTEIVKNILNNMRYSANENNHSVATISLTRVTRRDNPMICLRSVSQTGRNIASNIETPSRNAGTQHSDFMRAQPFGAELHVKDACFDSIEEPWDQSWFFLTV